MNGWPLRAKVPAIALGLLLVSQLVIGVAALALVQRSLIAQVDSRLESASRAVAARPVANLTADQRTRLAELPSDYVVLYHDASGNFLSRVSSAVSGSTTTPRLAIDADAVGPYTTREIGGIARWRLATRTLPNDRGTVTVALPLAEVTAATTGLRRTLALVFLATAAVGAFVAWRATHRALRPLRDAEATAAAIAGGDWSSRVPEAAASTEAGSLARSLNTMLDQLQRAFAAQRASEERLRTFLADASHELRTPLASIRGYAELQQLDGAADAKETAARIEANAVRMGALVEDLLTLARYDTAAAETGANERVDLSALLDDAASDARARAPDRSVTVTGTDRAVVVHGSARHLRQVVANVCANALTHTPDGTPVELDLSTDGAAAVVTIRDHGPGIALADRERVFERFYRPDASRARETGGSGLGLAIVASIVAAHGGSVAAVAPRGGGTAIVIRLPLADRTRE